MNAMLLFFMCCLLPLMAHAEPLPYAVAAQALPVYNSRETAASELPPQSDQCGQVRQLEFIALPGTPFRVVNETRQGQQSVLEVTSEAYPPPPGIRLFVRSDGLTRRATPAPMRSPGIPLQDDVLRKLRAALGLPYVWGGNLRQGLQLGTHGKRYAGLDCSGLLYDATNGFTPRNTADLVTYGQAVPISGLQRDQLIKRLKPLDLIVWKGHLVIVLDREYAIESVLWCGQPGNGGVRLTPLRQRLGEIMALRRGVDSWPAGGSRPRLFVVRRWLP